MDNTLRYRIDNRVLYCIRIRNDIPMHASCCHVELWSSRVFSLRKQFHRRCFDRWFEHTVGFFRPNPCCAWSVDAAIGFVSKIRNDPGDDDWYLVSAKTFYN